MRPIAKHNTLPQPSATRLLYVSHVDWGPVRQRPQQITSALKSYAEVTVAHPVARESALAFANATAGIPRMRLWRLPGSYRSAAVLALNDRLCAIQLAPLLARLRPDIVVVTAPECFAWTRRGLGRAQLVYDCMDDTLAFPQDQAVREHKAALERELIAAADCVVASCATLASRCKARGALPERLHVVGNGWDPQAFPVVAARNLPSSGALTLGYFGTIGPWFDFAALESVLRACPDATIRLIGPNEARIAVSDRRIVLLPPVPHERLASAVGDCHALLLPFKIDELTRAVDPVKLYEYIALGQPVLAIHYPELERFAEFVTLCKDGDDMGRRLAGRTDIIAPSPTEERSRFLFAQRWEARAAMMARALRIH